MKMLEKFMDHISGELEGAMEYAEKYIENKAKGNTMRANAFKEMAGDELRHAERIHEFSSKDIQDVEHVYALSDEEKEKWEHFQKKYVHTMALIKHMLS